MRGLGIKGKRRGRGGKGLMKKKWGGKKRTKD